MTTPPGVAAATLYPLDATQGPCGQLLRQDGSVVCWGAVALREPRPYTGVDIWDLNALGTRTKAPARGHPYRPHEPPQPTGPDTWPPPRDIPAPPTRAVDSGHQPDLWSAP